MISRKLRNQDGALAVFLSILAAVVSSIHIAWMVKAISAEYTALDDTNKDSRTEKLLMNAIDPRKIEANLERLTSKVHRAGTAENHDVARFIRDSFLDYGLDKVEIEDYNVLLSYPNLTHPDKVEILDHRSGKILETFSDGQSKASRNTGVHFSAFAKAASVTTTKLVYANYGRQEDFDYLVNTAKIDLTGSIVLVKEGIIYRGTKVHSAEQHGVVGVLLYNDPIDTTYRNRTFANATYPNTIYMPPTVARYGDIVATCDGDLLTPLLPAKDYVIRHNLADLYKSRMLPNISVTPISYDEAQKLLESIDGSVAPETWRGGLPVTYRLGPKLKDDRSVRLTVTTYPERRTIRNVIGYLRGAVEPDRYVILGNHYDAWGHGGVDPESGMAALLEVARAFMDVANSTGWRPRRTILFCAWDGEEYGFIGSSEFVQQYLKRFESKTIAYMNVDCAIRDTETLRAKAVPLLRKVLFSAAAKVENPNPDEIRQGRKTVYDTWVHKMPLDPTLHPSGPRLDLVGSGSDYRHFLHYAGISSLEFRYSAAERDTYPLYHTVDDTMELVRLMDPSFAYIQAVTRVWTEMARELSDTPVIPFNVTDYGYLMEQYIDKLTKTVEKSSAKSYANVSYIQKAGRAFLDATVAFDAKVSAVLASPGIDPLRLRALNDQLMLLERLFIVPAGLPDRPYLRHVIFAPSVDNTYEGTTFAGVTDTLNHLSESLRSGNKLDERSTALNDQISWAAHCIYSAADWLTRDL